MGINTAETSSAKIRCRGFGGTLSHLVKGVAERTLKRHEGKQGGNDGFENADLLGKEHAERHANRNDDLHMSREKLAQSNPLLHVLVTPLLVNPF
ncbi:MAG: hypothetical protein ACLTYW_04545 [Collinsella sp.]